MALTRKVTRAAAATAKDILQPDPKSVASSEEERKDDENLGSEKRKKSIVEWIDRPLKPPLSN